ncbi:helicase [Methylocystis bryophila]|uniref:Helicase n=1 Tax=Methylocystis bryophila TaxID=655015 RepID=A0A1W6N0A6_9HYPH|nr:helicase [Methylocystis bryophila]
MAAPLSSATPRPASRAPQLSQPPHKGVAALLGPTNTGKTHHAIERMLSFKSGLIGLPLRLLAREVYGRVVQKVGADRVALVTGEEKIKPPAPDYWVATVEAMPRDLDVEFLAIDEAQLAADYDRGHIFTDRLLRWRGKAETLLIGAQTLAPVIQRFLPGAPIFSRPRMSQLTHAGARKIVRLPPRSAVVAFSAEEVYAIAEWIKRQRGGAAVVLGALSPKTRNAQVELYQSGEVDYIVATDAIGMGLNLDIDLIAFASDRKFDGWRHRRLTSAEFGQIAGRAGRHMSDGAFATTGRCPPFDEELVEALEAHRFDPVATLQWRNPELDFSSIEDLAASLDRAPKEPGLVRAPPREDQIALEILARDEGVRRNAKVRADVERLWEACQIPDYRKTSPAAHAELAATIFAFIARRGKIPPDWIARQIALVDMVEGDIATLANRLAQVRTWCFVANHAGWLDDAAHWQGVARRVEDRLSSALHEGLIQRFVDRRASVLMRRLRENAMLEAEITSGGDVIVEGQHVGSLQGFRFTADPSVAGEAAKALNAAAHRALGAEYEARSTRIADAVDEAFALANDGTIRWLGEPVGRIAPGPGVLKPTAQVLADPELGEALLEKVKRRLELWLAQRIKKLLGALEPLESGEGLSGTVRGVAFQIAEELGVLERYRVAKEIRNFSQEDRAALRKLGVRFGAYHLYLPLLLKPAPRSLASLLWALRHGGLEGVKGLEEAPHLAASGRTSFAADPNVGKEFYRAAGYRLCGDRVVRVDILERLADLIRPAIAYRPGASVGEPPAGTADGDGFVVTVAMTSLTGCSGEAFASILRSLGYVSAQRPGPAITVPIIPAAATKPVVAAPAAEEGAAPATEAAVTKPEAAEPETTEPGIAEPAGDAIEAGPAAEALEIADATVAEVEVPAPAEGEPAAPPEATPAPETDEGATAQAGEPEATAPSETPESEAAPQDAALPEAAAPVAMIEVWVQQRHSAQGPRRHHGGGEARGPRQGAERERGPHRSSPQRAEGEGAAPARAEGEARNRSAPSGPRPPHKGETAGRGDRRPENRAPRDESRRNPVGGPKKQRERLPDPDSPFAKLLALKAELEKKGKS